MSPLTRRFRGPEVDRLREGELSTEFGGRDREERCEAAQHCFKRAREICWTAVLAALPGLF